MKSPVFCDFFNLPPSFTFLEWRNTTKTLSNIWQRFSCLLDEGITKLCKKFNSKDSFLRTDQDRVLYYLAGSSKKSCIFLQSHHQVYMNSFLWNLWKIFAVFLHSINILCHVATHYFTTIRMSHSCHTMVDGVKFWITYKRLSFLSSFSHWQVI